MAAVVHRDNKLVPAMLDAVAALLEDTADSHWNQHTKGLLDYLQAMEAERRGTIHTQENENKYIPQSGVTGVDATIRFMERKAAAVSASFQVSIKGSIVHLVEDTISETDLSTLIADLMDNAIYAVKDQPLKNIRLSIYVANGSYCLEVLDSGVPFPDAVLSELGRKQVTSHPEEGGHGIGMVTVFEILRRCHASFVLDDTIPGKLYTKRLTILFDGMSQLRICSNRAYPEARKKRKDIAWSP